MADVSSILDLVFSFPHLSHANLLGVAGLVCFLCSYTALTLVARSGIPGKTSSDPWLTAAAVVIGCGIWAADFVTIYAFRPDLLTMFSLGWALLPPLIGIVCAGLGFALVIRHRPLAGGAMVGAAIAAMNYTVVLGLPSSTRGNWHIAYALFALVIGAASGAGSLKYAASRPGWFGQVCAATCLAIGTLLIQSCGIAGPGSDANQIVPNLSGSSQTVLFPIAVTAICILIVGLGVIGSLVHQHIAELETTKHELESTADELRLTAHAAAAATAAKSAFLASMSHELRTPLNAIIGFSELLKENIGRSSEHVREYSTNIHDSGRHLLSLINDILDLSKIDAGELKLYEEPIDVGQSVVSCMRLLEPQARKGKIHLDCSLPDEIVALWGDDRRLRQILFNLLSNAIKFTGEGGHVQVSVDWSSGGLGIRVADTGIGMTAEEIPQALERFGQVDSRLSRKYEGTGLGLSLTKHLLELHGGTLDISSAPGVGTTVTACFPPDRVMREREAA